MVDVPLRIAVVYICTGRYAVFWPTFLASAERHLLSGNEVHYFVFTDAVDLHGRENPRVHPIATPARPWPYGTLDRFAYMLDHEETFRAFDHVLFMNSNLEVVADVNPADLLPRPSMGERLVVVRHPGFVASGRHDLPYEARRESLAHVGADEGEIYVCGGINGGTGDAFMDLARELDRRIIQDSEHGVIATWHDESHLNRYIIGRSDVRVLDPAFCYPVGWDGDYPEIIRLRAKTELIGEASFKGWGASSSRSARALSRAKRLARAVLRRFRGPA